MRVRTSVTLPKELLIKVDALAGKKHKRSEIVESALREYVAKENGRELNRRDIEIINANADKLNEEALDTLEYQQVNW
ncbi:MAG: ribbon-helix-helix protein, CopG family [Pyrinomonadaceae bacterium]